MKSLSRSLGVITRARLPQSKRPLKANQVDYLQGFGCSQNGPFDDEVERAESYLAIVLNNGTTCTTMDAQG